MGPKTSGSAACAAARKPVRDMLRAVTQMIQDSASKNRKPAK